MSAQSYIGQLPEELKQREESFVPHYLRASFQYLKDTREATKGWPRYQGLPSELHTTALAVQALSLMPDPYAGVLVAGGALATKHLFPYTDSMALQDLLDLLSIALAEETRDTGYIRNLMSRLDEIGREVTSGAITYTTATICQAVIVEQSLAAVAHSRNTWLDVLLARQRRDVGGWPTMNGDPVTAVSTAWAVRALAGIDSQQAAKAVAAGGTFLKLSLAGG